MAKASKGKKPTRKIGGPFLAAAVFCERILEDTDRVLTVSRILDGINILLHPQTPPELPSKAHPLELTPNMLFIFRSGDSPGKHAFKLIVQQPNGKRSVAMEQEIELSPDPQGGCNLKTNATLKLFSSGLFWFDVVLDGKRFTRMPLNIQIHRAEMPTLTKSDSKSTKK
jgi:hypothetical protein